MRSLIQFSPIVLLTSLMLLAASACSDEENSSSKLQVVTSFSVLDDIVGEVGGDRVEVFSVVPSGADPHTFEPAPRDVQRITEADLAFANGLGLEPAALKIIGPNLPSRAPLVRLAEGAEEAGVSIIPFESAEHEEEGYEGEEEEGHEHGDEDPHLWLSIANVKEYARMISESLAKADSEGAQEYEQNYARYEAELDELEQYLKSKVATVPAERRKFVTTHDSLGYLTRDINFQVVGFVAPGPGQEPSPTDIAELAGTIRQQNVPAVFVEPQLGTEGRTLQRVADDAGVMVCTLYSDSLDDKVKSYVDLMRFNADEIARCLGGT